uniref:SCAN box domain-containing protein n=1 Tax=Leptobrachium leishanense TaxID=445787 RepID=A0A8C5LSD7_9ANUR
MARGSGRNHPGRAEATVRWVSDSPGKHRTPQAKDSLCRLRVWFRGCQATHPDQIIQLLLLEQFYNYSPPEVRDWVRDRRPLTLPEATRLTDEYQDARRAPWTCSGSTGKVLWPRRGHRP